MYKSGSILQNFSENWFHCVVVLQNDGQTTLVRDYWETNHETNFQELELRVHVKRMSVGALASYNLVGSTVIGDLDFREIVQFQTIETGLNARRNRTLELPNLVEEKIRAKNYSEAIILLQEWAMLDKTNVRIYELRIDCYLKTGELQLAEYDKQLIEILLAK